MRVTVLGSGTSTGVPVIGCDCNVCSSVDEKNKRTRASIMVECAAGRFVIDTTPEFRIQMIRERVNHLDGVLYTHLHADHCHGFDDLRAFYFRAQTPLPIYIAKSRVKKLQQKFAYAFEDTGYLGAKPQVELRPFAKQSLFDLGGQEVETFCVEHGSELTSVFRFGEFAYATDFKRFSATQIKSWRGKVSTMIASGIRFKPHDTHSNVEETLALFKAIGVRRGIITHLSHDIDYLRDGATLPDGVSFAYDGMLIDVTETLT